MRGTFGRRCADARLARWLVVFGLMTAVGVEAPAARAQVSTGTLNLHLGPPAGTTLVSTTALISSPSTSLFRTVAEGPGTGEFAVTALPVANDYTVNVTSTSSGGLLCTGSSAAFPVEANTTTILFVSLTCASPVPALSARHGALLAASLLLAAGLALRPRRRREFRLAQ